MTDKLRCPRCGIPTIDDAPGMTDDDMLCNACASEERPGFWSEYDSAAEWCARGGIKGEPGDPLPPGLAADVCAEIADHPEDFERRVRETAYGLAMEQINLPAY